MVAAEAPVELILALERQGADGIWHTDGCQSQGRSPILGVPIGDAAARRILVWTADGGTVPIRLAARVVQAAATPIGTIRLAPVVLDGITRQWQAALVADSDAMMLRLTDPGLGLLAASAPNQPAAPVTDGTIVAATDTVWLLAPEPGSVRLEAVDTRSGAALTLAIPASGRATLRSAAPAALCTPTLPPPGSVSREWMPGEAWARPREALSHCVAARLWHQSGTPAARRHCARAAPALRTDAAARNCRGPGSSRPCSRLIPP